MSLAIAYAMKKKKMAKGGAIEDAVMETPELPMSDLAKGMKKAFHAPGYAKGGDVEGVHYRVKGVHEKLHPEVAPKGVSAAGTSVRDAREHPHKGHMAEAKEEHREVLKEMHEMKGHDRKYMAEGGEACVNCGHMAGHPVENQDMGEEEDMIGRIMKKRVGHYSEGGKVANETEPKADFEEAEYDDLVKDDELEEHYTGKNSGDEVGNEAEEEDEKDVVSRIMKSRKKKDKMPHPA